MSATVDYGAWEVDPEDRHGVDEQAKRLPDGWHVQCGGTPQALPLIVEIRDADGNVHSQAAFNHGRFDHVARFIRETAPRDLEVDPGAGSKG